MPATSSIIRRLSIALAGLLAAATLLPALAAAMPAYEGSPRVDGATTHDSQSGGTAQAAGRTTLIHDSQSGGTAQGSGDATPIVTRTIVTDDAFDALPVILAGAALIVALTGAGYMLLTARPSQRVQV